MRVGRTSPNDPFYGFGAQFGYHHDAETGFYLLGHRYYNPYYARFVNQDPIGLAGGFNLYGYVGQNPLAGIDPSGHGWRAAVGGLVGGLVGLATLNPWGVAAGVFGGMLVGDALDQKAEGGEVDMAEVNMGLMVAGGAIDPGVGIGEGECVCELEGANFAQENYGETFHPDGNFKGRTIDSVASDLRSGAMKAKDVPVKFVRRAGVTLVHNTRSAQALERAGIPRSQCVGEDCTGVPFFEKAVNNQLRRSKLGPTGTPTTVSRAARGPNQ